MVEEGDFVLYSTEAGVATLTLNRPGRLNAWTPEMGDRYFDLLERADRDPDVRVIVITGTGKGFCPGLDSAILSSRVSGGPELPGLRRPMTFALTQRKMMIAAINGACAGLGLLQALCCDVRFAASDARIASAFTRRGLAPEFGSGWLLSRAVGSARASDLLLSARTISGTEAEKIGLVIRAVPFEQLAAVVYDYARDVAANCSPRAIAYAKADLLTDWTRTWEQAQADAPKVLQREGHVEDVHEGVTSFIEKRPPQFENVSPIP